MTGRPRRDMPATLPGIARLRITGDEHAVEAIRQVLAAYFATTDPTAYPGGRAYLDVDTRLDARLAAQRAAFASRLKFDEGERVRLTAAQRAIWTHEDLEYEGEDATEYAKVPFGALGRITRVRRYPSPYPYVVLFDDDTEIGVREGDLERA